MTKRHLGFAFVFMCGVLLVASVAWSAKKKSKKSNPETKTFAAIKWQKVPKATGYYIEIATDQNFQNPEVKEKVKKPVFKWKNPKPGRYFFRIASIHPSGDLSPFSHVRPVMVRYPAPRPVWPLELQIVHLGKEIKNPFMQWKSVSGIKLHEVEISMNVLFDDPVFKKQSRNFKIKFPDLEPGEYHWRIRALSASGIPSHYSKPVRIEVKVNELSQNRIGRHFKLKPYDERVRIKWWRHLYGSGHYANGHLRTGITSNVITFASLLLGITTRAKSKDFPSNYSDTQSVLINDASLKSFETSRKHFFHRHRSDVLFMVAGFNFAGSILDSIFLAGRSEEDPTTFMVGAHSLVGYRGADAIYSIDSTNVDSGKITDSSNVRSNTSSKMSGLFIPGMTLGYTSGKVVHKSFLLDIGFGTFQIRYDTWVPIRLKTIGAKTKSPLEIFVAMGYRMFHYQTQTKMVGLKKNFGVSTGSLFLRAFTKTNVSIFDWHDLPLTGGIQFNFMDLGTVWEHPTVYQWTDTNVNDVVLSKRAVKRNLLTTFGFRIWAQLKIKYSLVVHLDLEWMRSVEQALTSRIDPRTPTPKFDLALIQLRVLWNF